jgi:flavin reductase (DIM6/NTAB) family NADH-FMN oxidoreductase RutF
MIIDPATLDHQEAYKLLNGAVVPRPIALVSTVSAKGERNVAPFSFFNVVASDPMAISFSVMRRGISGNKKDTILNIEETGEFVVNVVTQAIAQKTNEASADFFARGVDEFEAVGFTPLASEVVAAPRVAESPINMECRVLQLVDLGDRPGSATLVIGQVVRFHAWDVLFRKGRIDPEQLQAVGRMAGAAWVRTGDTFDLIRPSQPISS